MQVSRRGLLYKIAYGYRGELNQPNQSNLCQFFRAVIGGVLLWVFVILLEAIVFTVITPIAFMAGYKPTRMGDWPLSKPMSFQPKIKKIWKVIGTILLFSIVGLFCLGILWLLGSWIFGSVIESLVGRAIVISIFSILIAWTAWRLWRKTETYQVIKTYIRAKKDKVCPIIEFK